MATDRPHLFSALRRGLGLSLATASACSLLPSTTPESVAPESVAPESADPAPEPADPAPAPSPAELAAWTDARNAGPLVTLARQGAVTERRAALWALARIHDDEATGALVVGLRDPDAEARRAAAFGVGAREAHAPAASIEALLGAYAVEPAARSEVRPEASADPAEVVRSVRAMMVWSLARTGDRQVEPALRRALDDDGESRVAACRGLAYARPTGWSEDLLEQALDRATSDPTPAVREACWQGLGRVTLPSPLAARAAEGALAALTAPGSDEELQIQACRVLGRGPIGDAARTALGDAAVGPSWRLAVAALRALGPASSGHEGALAAVLDRVEARWWPAVDTEGAAEPSAPGAVHVLLTALEIAQPVARAQPVYERAQRWLSHAEHGASGRDGAWLVCRAAELVDLGRGWPSRVERCAVDVLDDDTRRGLAAEVLGRGEGAEAQRLAFLERLFRDGGPRAREAVLSAAAALPATSTLPLLRSALADDDEGVTLAGLELLQSVAASLRHSRDDEALARTLRGETASTPRLLSELDEPLLAAGRRLLEGSSLEARVTWSGALEALADPGTEALSAHRELLRTLATHPAEGVREAAARALTAFGETDLASAVGPVPEPLAVESLTALPHRARIATPRGELVIELFAERAPTTVARFAGLARAGAYDGLSFHRVVAGFVVQGGDPRGDGYGGPDWWQRCEDTPLGYERGTVGMALAGRDTGGSQFFVTLGPQHHLDGRYTVFGRVVEGLEHLDALQVGDAMEHVTVE